MIRPFSATVFRLLPALALGACATPRAVIVEKAPEKKTGKPAEAALEVPALPGEPDDGIRLPMDQLLAIPGDGDFRAPSLPLPTGSAGPGAVTVRPPTDPPSRPKPKETENQ